MLGFRPNYICWTKHGENGIMMEEGEEEQLEPDDIIAQYGDLGDTAMGEAEDEAGAEGAPIEDDALGDVIHDAQKYCESEKEKTKFDHMLEDHKKITEDPKKCCRRLMNCLLLRTKQNRSSVLWD